MPTSPIWRGFMANADYVWITGDAFTDMRLLIEGAVVLYENDVMPLYSMAMEQERYQEAAGLDTLGAALTTLQSDIRELQNAYTAYQVESEVEESKETTGFADRFQEQEKG